MVDIINRRFRLPAWIGYVAFLDIPFSDEPFLLPFLISAPAGLALDIGAHSGDWSKTMLELGREVVAFEPDPRVFRLADRLKSKYGPRFTIHHIALSDYNGTAKFGRAFHPGLNSLAYDPISEVNTIEVPVKTLDSLGLGKVGYIKTDTEGSDLAILRGARSIIARDKPTLAIEIHDKYNHYEAETERCFALLESMDYSGRIVHVRPNGQPHIIGRPQSDEAFNHPIVLI